jgi:WD40 repeat protein
MKRFFAVSAFALISILAAAGCNDYGNTFQNNTGAAVTSLSPANVNAGSGDFTLTVNGSGFVAKTYVTWNGKKLDTTVTLDSTNTIVLSVTAVVPAALVAKPGTATVITQNPFSGAGNNGLSNPVIFVINPPPNPVPALSALVPASIASCGSDCASASFTLDLTGSNFLTSSDPTQTSQVRWTAGATQTTLTTTSVSATDIKATVPGALYSAEGTASVTVFNPPAPATGPAGGTTNPSGGGGGSSAAQTFTITAASPMNAKATANSAAEETPAVSTDGRYVAWTSQQNEHTQILLRDTCEGAASGCKPQTNIISTTSDGRAANDDSNSPSMSADGRYVAFSSAATNLVENAPAGRQIYLRDTCAGAEVSCSPTTQLVSTDSTGALTGADSLLPSVSASGRFIAFLAVTASAAPHTGATSTGTTNSGYRQVFIRDTCLGAAASGASACTPKTSRVSVQPGDGKSPSATGSATSGADEKRAGPALGADGQGLALNGQAATLFTRSVAVDDRIFLAITKLPN